MAKKRVVLALTGASGQVLGGRMLEVLGKKKDVELHVVISEGAKRVEKLEEVAIRMPSGAHLHDDADLAAPVASGSFGADATIICPCSVKTLGGIAHGYSDSLIVRVAEVALKERRPLVIVLRETPLSAIALGNAWAVSHAGGIILPANVGFYARPESVEDMVDFVVGKALDSAGIENELYKRWMGEEEKAGGAEEREE